jgi:hypothetical protein
LYLNYNWIGLYNRINVLKGSIITNLANDISNNNLCLRERFLDKKKFSKIARACNEFVTYIKDMFDVLLLILVLNIILRYYYLYIFWIYYVYDSCISHILHNILALKKMKNSFYFIIVYFLNQYILWSYINLFLSFFIFYFHRR